jgi:hypothetical protein
VEKIMHCDEVIHLQQLSVPWSRPTDPIFNFLNDGQAKGEDIGGDMSQAEISNRGSQAVN